MTSRSEYEQRAWEQLKKQNGGRIWTGCDLCKTFGLGLIAGFIITFIAIAIL